MKLILSTIIFSILTLQNCFGQKKYSFGTDYGGMFYYPTKSKKWPFGVFQVGVAATREISIRSHLVAGVYYYQLQFTTLDLHLQSNKYIEIPISIKTDFSVLDDVFVGQVLTGVGSNLLIHTEKYNPSNLFSKKSSSQNLDLESINLFLGFGFDIRMNRYFYLSMDGIMKGFIFFTKIPDFTGTKIPLVPTAKAGIFVWLN